MGGGGLSSAYDLENAARAAVRPLTLGHGDIDYKARANDWHGGQNIITETSAPTTSGTNCSPYYPGVGSYFETGLENAKTWTESLGLNISIISFQATSQTGYGTNAKLKYDFANATHTNYVCGTNAVPDKAWRTVVQSHT
jgi:hypothetical protein